MDEIFKNVPNVLGIAVDMLVVGYDIDGKDYDEMLCRYYRYADT